MKRFLYAVSFLTVIPAGPGGKFDARIQSRSLIFFSTVGALYGCAMAGAALLLSRILSPLAAGALITAGWTALSGALHLDGLADTADGFGGGRDAASRLAVMKDSRIGTFGAAAVCLLLVLKTALIAELGGSSGAADFPFGRLLTALVISPVMGRTLMAAAITAFPSAARKGLGAQFKAGCRPIDAVVCAAIAAVLATVLCGLSGLAAFAAVGAAGLGAGALLSRGLKGLNGDAYGALCEGGEAACLLMLAVLP